MKLLHILHKDYKNRRQGFVILYAILLTTVVLTIALSLLTVLVQQVSLSGTQRESLYSFSAADSGVECGLYADTVQDIFPIVGSGSNWSMNCGTSVSCNGSTLTPTAPASAAVSGSPTLTEWSCGFVVNLQQGNCADIEIKKVINNTTGALATTTLQSRGYNTSCPPAASTKPWRLERGIEVTY